MLNFGFSYNYIRWIIFYCLVKQYFVADIFDFYYKLTINHIIFDIVEVKCPFSALSSVVEAANDLKNIFLGKHTFTGSLMTYSLCTITCMLQYYFITQLWCNLLSRSVSPTMYTFVRAKLQAVLKYWWDDDFNTYMQWHA